MTNNNITTTHVYKVNGRLVVAKDAVEAINVLTEYIKDTSSEYEVEEITTLELITDGYPCSSNNALLKHSKIDISAKDIQEWLMNNIANSNKSIESIARELYKFITEWKQYKLP